MKPFFTKKSVIAAFFIAALGAALFAFFILTENSEPELSLPASETEFQNPKHEIIGSSVEGRDIKSFTFGSGEKKLVFVGGIHGGYEWNSVLLAYEFIDYLKASPEFIPEGFSVTVIPSMNPDGIFKVTGKDGRFSISDIPAGNNSNGTGRLNANGVDLNRNFDCNWKPKGIWRQTQVSGGTKAFSEPESIAIRDFVTANTPTAVIFWHSQSNSVYGSKCKADMLQETIDIMNAYAKASGYQALKTFDGYEVTGDATDWLASVGIPAITVELKTHETIEWEKNLSGIKSLLKYYENKE